MRAPMSRTDTVPSLEINIDPSDPGTERGDRDHGYYGSPRATDRNASARPGGKMKTTTPSRGRAQQAPRGGKTTAVGRRKKGCVTRCEAEGAGELCELPFHAVP